MRITVIGAGSWGMALSKVLSDNGHDVLVYDNNSKIVEKINTMHICIQLNEYVPESIQATDQLALALAHADVLFFVVPTKVLRAVIEVVLPLLDTPKLMVNAAKGIEPKTFKRVSEIFAECFDAKQMKGFVSLSGPTHAEEVIRGLPTLITSASTSEEDAKYVQKLLHNPHYFRVYSSTDLVAVELGGAIKNIFALASGILRGLGLGDNANAALMTRSLVEMGKIYEHFGASKDALMGLTGVGDLMVTCTSTHSRNYQAGYKIGKGKDLDETLNSMTMVVEGIRTTQAAYELIKQHHIEAPIIEALYDVLFNRVSPTIAYEQLLARTLKPE